MVGVLAFVVSLLKSSPNDEKAAFFAAFSSFIA
jgi:hypothetical protein